MSDHRALGARAGVAGSSSARSSARTTAEPFSVGERSTTARGRPVNLDAVSRAGVPAGNGHVDRVVAPEDSPDRSRGRVADERSVAACERGCPCPPRQVQRCRGDQVHARVHALPASRRHAMGDRAATNSDRLELVAVHQIVLSAGQLSDGAVDAMHGLSNPALATSRVTPCRFLMHGLASLDAGAGHVTRCRSRRGHRGSIGPSSLARWQFHKLGSKSGCAARPRIRPRSAARSAMMGA